MTSDRQPWRVWATTVEGVGLAVLVADGGTPAWQVVRCAGVTAAFAAASLLQRSRRPWVPLVVSAVAGLVGSVVGAGIGLGQLAKSEVRVPSVAALVVLVAALPLLVGGTVGLVRMLRGWSRLLAVPAVYVVLQFVVLPVSIGVYAANAPPGSLGTADPGTYGLRYRTVSFTTSDGVALAGWYTPSTNGAAVVVVPGAGSTRSTVLRQGAVLARSGYGVLFMDNRGHGTSGGTAMDFGWWGQRDLAAAVTYLEHRDDVRAGRIGILGESMGGEEAIGAIGSDPRVRAVVAEGVTGGTFADTSWRGDSLEALVSRADSWISYAVAGLLSSAPQPPSLRASLRAAAPRPALLVEGRGEAAPGRYFRSAAPGSVQLLDLPDSPHTGGLRAHPVVWERHVERFFARDLLGPVPRPRSGSGAGRAVTHRRG